MTFLSSPYAWIGTLPSSGGGGSGFTVPTPPTPSLGGRIPLRGSYTAGVGISGKCRYRPSPPIFVADRLWFANGYDAPWFTDLAGAAFYDMGSTKPTTGGGVVGSNGTALPTGQTRDYLIVWRDTTLKRETAPRAFSVANASGSTKDITISWTDPGLPALPYATIYAATQGTGTYYYVGDALTSAGTFTDTVPDATLSTNRAYVRRYRETPPPTFKGIAYAGKRFWGWTGLDALLYYSQIERADGEFVQDDFPSLGSTTLGGVLPVFLGDGLGPIVAVVEFFEAIYVFKRRACYRVTGRGTSTSPFDADLVFADRGCIAPRSIVAVEDRLFFCDERGPYVMAPDGSVMPAGADEGTRESPLAPRWERLNLDAANLIHAAIDLVRGTYTLHVPLDDTPRPEWAIVFDYRNNCFISTDPLSPSMAAGEHLDASGVRHRLRICDLGVFIEDGLGDADVLLSGTSTGTITATTALTRTVGAASFTTTGDGLLGAPVERFNAAGEVVGQNRVISNTGTVLRLQFYEATAVTIATDTLAVGGIPSLYKSGDLNFGDPRRKKTIRSIVLQYEQDSDTTVRVDGFVGENAGVNLKEFALSNADGKQLVPVRQSAFRWAFQISNRYPGMGWTVTAADIEIRVTGADRD